ncbi:hypothetical protein [Tortoise microvirus 104]|nr:hypothetical protein [Tortoise microvirus 6]QCS37456.1 hypothetical protein [Tortoise microvirus 104]
MYAKKNRKNLVPINTRKMIDTNESKYSTWRNIAHRHNITVSSFIYASCEYLSENSQLLPQIIDIIGDN